MDVDLLIRSQPALIFLGTLVLGWMGWAFRQHLTQLVQKAMDQAASKTAMELLAARVGAHGDRLMTIETAMQHLPSAAQVNTLNVAIAELRGELHVVGQAVRGVTQQMGENVERMEAQVGGIARRLDLIDAHLRENHQ